MTRPTHQRRPDGGRHSHCRSPNGTQANEPRMLPFMLQMGMRVGELAELTWSAPTAWSIKAGGP